MQKEPPSCSFKPPSFVTWLVHVTDAESTDAAKVMTKCKMTFQTSLTAMAVDNAAAKVMSDATDRYLADNPEEPNVIQNRDAGHCSDLLAKDSANIPCFKSLISDANLLIHFANTDRVDGIRREWIRLGKLSSLCVGIDKMSDTRFNKAGAMLESVLKQKPFYEMCIGMENSLKEYYNSRDQARRSNMDGTFGVVCYAFWQRLEIAIKWFRAIEYATKLVSSNDFPMSAYLPVVQAVWNEFNIIIANEGGRGFDEIFCEGANQQVASFVRCRFNMDGKRPAGRKVGLLDPYHIWAFLCDPFKFKLGKQLKIEPNKSAQAKEMIKFFLDRDCTEDDLERVGAEFREYYCQQGLWMDYFDDRVPPSLNAPDLIEEQKTITIVDVSNWVNKTGKHNGRLNFFALLPQNDLYSKVLEPLLSLRATGSIAVERIAKPLKRQVLGDYRVAMGDERAEICLRLGLNLRYLMKIRSHIRQTANQQD